MRHFYTLLIASLALINPASAEVLARVNGVPITSEMLQSQLQARPEMAARTGAESMMLDKLISGELLVQEASRLKLEEDPKVKAELEGLRRQVLANAAINRMLSAQPISDDEIKTRYERFAKQNSEEFRVRHILIKDEAEAIALRAKIAGEQDFTEQARAVSLDKANAQNGGDLGWVSPRQVLLEFSQAMLAAPIGKVAGPVQTAFGWHVFWVKEKRPSTNLPTLDEIKDRLAKELADERIARYSQSLREKAEITR